MGDGTGSDLTFNSHQQSVALENSGVTALWLTFRDKKKQLLASTQRCKYFARFLDIQ